MPLLGMPLGDNKQRQKLPAENNVNTIYLESIIRGQFSGWQLFGGNCQYATILWGNSLSATYLRANYPRVINGEAIFWGAVIWGALILGAIILVATVQEAIVREAIIWGAIILGAKCLGGNYLEGNCPEAIILGSNCLGGNYLEGNCPGAIIWGLIVRAKLSGEGQLSGVNYLGGNYPRTNLYKHPIFWLRLAENAFWQKSKYWFQISSTDFIAATKMRSVK